MDVVIHVINTLFVLTLHLMLLGVTVLASIVLVRFIVLAMKTVKK